jgi:hypothetical protein
MADPEVFEPALRALQEIELPMRPIEGKIDKNYYFVMPQMAALWRVKLSRLHLSWA